MTARMTQPELLADLRATASPIAHRAAIEIEYQVVALRAILDALNAGQADDARGIALIALHPPRNAGVPMWNGEAAP